MRRRWARAGLITTAIVAACGFQHGSLQGSAGDARIDSQPDASACTGLTDECLGDTWRHCAGLGATAVDVECGWGCSDTQSTVTNTHCVVVSPSGNGGNIASGASPSDTLPNDQLHDVTLGAGVLIDGDTGKMGNPPTPTLRNNGGIGIINGIDFQRRGPVSVFRFKSLTIDGSIALIGAHSIVLVADGEIKINAHVDVRGPCTTTIAGPGGGSGATNQGGDAPGAAGGQGIPSNNFGGGGGGNGGRGGDGGNGTSGNNSGGADGGSAIVDPQILTLVGGGGGGGGGGGPMTGAGGGGGGAIQLVSNTKITITSNGGINAGGCGGQSANGGNDGGGGGGAGGTILIEVPKLAIAGTLAVNGGGGGGGDAGNLNRAAHGSLDRNPASGSNGSADGGDGAAGSDAPEQGKNDNNKGGGGGGGIGRIRLNTRHGLADADLTGATLSPSTSDPTSTCTIGTPATAP